MNRDAALRSWVILFLGIILIVIGAQGKLGSGLAAILTPSNMTEIPS